MGPSHRQESEVCLVFRLQRHEITLHKGPIPQPTGFKGPADDIPVPDTQDVLYPDPNWSELLSEHKEDIHPLPSTSLCLGSSPSSPFSQQTLPAPHREY